MSALEVIYQTKRFYMNPQLLYFILPGVNNWKVSAILLSRRRNSVDMLTTSQWLTSWQIYQGCSKTLAHTKSFGTDAGVVITLFQMNENNITRSWLTSLYVAMRRLHPTKHCVRWWL